MLFKQLAKDSAIYGGADFVSKIVSFFTFPFIARALNPESFGFVELILTSTALIAVVGNVGANNSVQRFYWDSDVDQIEQKRILSSGFFSLICIFTALFVIISFVILVFLPQLGTEFNFTWIGIFSALVLMMGTQWTQYLLDVLRLQFKVWEYFLISIISRVFSSILGLICVVIYNTGIDGFLFAQASVIMLVLPLAFYFVRKDFRVVYLSKKWILELLNFGYPFIFSSLAYWVFSSQDRWMLASMSSVNEVGIFSISFRFASVLLFISAAFGQAWSPFAMKLRVDRPTEYRQLYGDILLILFFIMAFLGTLISLFSGELIAKFLGEKYIESGLSLIVLVFSIVFQSTQQITGIGISLEKKTILFVHLSWIAAAINFLLNYILIPYYGSLGASFATLISYMFLSGGYLYFTQKLHPIYLNFKKLVFLVIICFLSITSSLYLFSTEFSFWHLIIKVGFSILFLFFGLMIIPYKKMKYVKD